MNLVQFLVGGFYLFYNYLLDVPLQNDHTITTGSQGFNFPHPLSMLSKTF
nr:MAG TPA: hypothetical protein [Caudoviricetes sp.]